MPDEAQLVAAAVTARGRAHAPFSGFKVGAALLARDASGGARIYTGCNIESATFGLTVCAERVAIWQAVADGATAMAMLVVVADSVQLTPPCGACRQIIWEFCGDIPVVLANLAGASDRHGSGDLLPLPFDAAILRSGAGSR